MRQIMKLGLTGAGRNTKRAFRRWYGKKNKALEMGFEELSEFVKSDALTVRCFTDVAKDLPDCLETYILTEFCETPYRRFFVGPTAGARKTFARFMTYQYTDGAFCKER